MALTDTLSISLFLLVWQSALVSANLSASRLVVIDDERSRMTGSYPSKERRDAIFQDITASLQNILLDSFLKTCGSGEWHRWWLQLENVTMNRILLHHKLESLYIYLGYLKF